MSCRYSLNAIKRKVTKSPLINLSQLQLHLKLPSSDRLQLLNVNVIFALRVETHEPSWTINAFNAQINQWIYKLTTWVPALDFNVSSFTRLSSLALRNTQQLLWSVVNQSHNIGFNGAVSPTAVCRRSQERKEEQNFSHLCCTDASCLVWYRVYEWLLQKNVLLPSMHTVWISHHVCNHLVCLLTKCVMEPKWIIEGMHCYVSETYYNMS